MPFKHEQERAWLSGGFSSRRLALVSKIQRPSLSDQNGYQHGAVITPYWGAGSEASRTVRVKMDDVVPDHDGVVNAPWRMLLTAGAPADGLTRDYSA